MALRFLVVLPITLCLLTTCSVAGVGPHEVFKMGVPVDIECKNPSGQWGPGPVCRETGQPLRFTYGIETFFHCTVDVDKQFYDFLRDATELRVSWTCRVPMTLDRYNFLPLSLPMWGFAEPTHTHVIPHMNFLFHAQDGYILGASAYPVRDRLEVITEGSQLNLHGPTRWFHGHTFLPITQVDAAPSTSSSSSSSATIPGPKSSSSSSSFFPSFLISGSLLIVLYGLMTFFFSLLLVIALYRFILKPRLIRKHLKQD